MRYGNFNFPFSRSIIHYLGLLGTTAMEVLFYVPDYLPRSIFICHAYELKGWYPLYSHLQRRHCYCGFPSLFIDGEVNGPRPTVHLKAVYSHVIAESRSILYACENKPALSHPVHNGGVRDLVLLENVQEEKCVLYSASKIFSLGPYPGLALLFACFVVRLGSGERFIVLLHISFFLSGFSSTLFSPSPSLTSSTAVFRLPIWSNLPYINFHAWAVQCRFVCFVGWMSMKLSDSTTRPSHLGAMRWFVVIGWSHHCYHMFLHHPAPALPRCFFSYTNRDFLLSF